MKKFTRKQLTTSEQAVQALLLQGYSNLEIGQRLNIAEKTVKFHVTKIFLISNCKSRSQLIARHYMRAIEKLTFQKGTY